MGTRKKNRREKSKRREMAEKGILMEAYSTTSFVKVYPALGIDKIKFSFVDIGTNGKGGYDIFVDTDSFDILCDDILSKELKRSLLAEKKTKENPYPCSWEFRTGDFGEMEIKISKGMKSEVNIYGKFQKNIKNIPISYEKLCIMAKYFRRISTPYFDMLTDLTIQGMKENEKYFKQQEENEEKIIPMTFTTMSEIKHLQDNMYCMKVADKNKTMTKLYFNESSINALGAEKWNDLLARTKTTKLVLNILARENRGEYLFISLEA